MDKLKLIGIVSSTVGIVANIVSEVVKGKKQENLMESKVKEALAKQIKDRA